MAASKIELRGGFQLGMSFEEAKKCVPAYIHDAYSSPDEFGIVVIGFWPSDTDSVFDGIEQVHVWFVHSRAYHISIMYYEEALPQHIEFTSFVAQQFGIPDKWERAISYNPNWMQSKSGSIQFDVTRRYEGTKFSKVRYELEVTNIPDDEEHMRILQLKSDREEKVKAERERSFKL